MLFGRKNNGIFNRRKYKVDKPFKYKNRSKVKSVLSSKIFIFLNFILLVGILFSVYFFIFSDYYNISCIEIEGNENISTEDLLEIVYNNLEEKRYLVFSNKNIFIFSKKMLSEKISDEIILEDIKINKIVPNCIKVKVTEKNAVIKWQSGENKYLVDENGQIIKKFYVTNTPDIFKLNDDVQESQNNRELGDYIQVVNESGDKPNLGDFVLNGENIESIIKINNELSKISYINVTGISVPNNYPKQVNFVHNNGPQFYFNLYDNINSQINRLKTVINDKISENNLDNIEYVDLRLGESVFYK